jgi:hypothetical protein
MTKTLSGPEIRLISPERLMIDTLVQRGYIDKKRVDKIVAEFDARALGVLAVSDRGDGTYHVMDGGHRWSAVSALGRDIKLECKVYTGLARADEALMFRLLNNSRAVQAIDKFRVRVVENDPVAVKINDVLHRYGWKVQQSKENGSFAAVAAIEAVYRGNKAGKTDNIGVVETLVNVITEAWGFDADGMRREIVSGIGAVLLRHDSIDLAKLTAELAQFPGGALRLVGSARGLRDARGGRLSDAMAEKIIILMNKNRRTNRLPDWRDAA